RAASRRRSRLRGGVSGLRRGAARRDDRAANRRDGRLDDPHPRPCAAAARALVRVAGRERLAAAKPLAPAPAAQEDVRAEDDDHGERCDDGDPRPDVHGSRETIAMQRCAWVPLDDPLYVAYHDDEWGTPEHDDRRLFELLTLEGAQAGLSWSTILHKREGYRRAFAGFDAEKVGRLDAEQLLQDAGIVRNRLKVESAISNASRVREVQDEFGSLDAYLWSFVGGEPLVNRP